MLRGIRDAGATAFRLNASHLAPEALRTLLAAIRRDVPGTDVIVDLQGAKMRLGPIAERDVSPGDRLAFTPSGDEHALALPHAEFFLQSGPGDTLSVDDGRLRFRVVSCAPGRLEAVALNAGRLRPRKGVNLIEHPVTLAGLTAADRATFDASRADGVTRFAFSFMEDGREAGWLQDLDPACRVVGKVERREAVESLASIAKHVDAIWICRGDLGSQLGAAGLARFVAALQPSALPVPVLMAGQVFEHLTRHPEPTRSEVCHLFDLLGRGYAGVVLSDETAIGSDPIGAVRAVASLLADFSRQP